VVSDPPPDDKKQTAVKSDSLATKDDNQKKARQQTDQRMKHQNAQRVGDSKVTRDNPAGRMVLSPDDPTAKAKGKAARVKK
jgi:flagellar basal body rod protein FlgC